MSELSEQHELHTSGFLLDARGNVTQVGWSRQPLLDCNLEQANFYRLRSLQPFRIKRWDYYGVTTPSFYFSVTLADLGYAGQAFAYFVDFEQGQHTEETVTIPFGSGMRLPRNSMEGESIYQKGSLKIQFVVRPEERHLMVEWPGFSGKDLVADLKMNLPSHHESMVIVIPFTRGRCFYISKGELYPGGRLGGGWGRAI
ncbi:MAG: hypothetical protein A2Z14_19845 [Chloroflexi bacterium RBG_16_48_8]|nr:MAG: hypothetical protein A2Z14_19845 [Chloroflexi bacterium RBG_16_48_8]